MNAKVLLPSLSDDGWVNGSIRTADYLFSHFLLSDFSQSYIYNGFVVSFPYILQNTQGNMIDTVDQTNRALETYFTKYFNNVVVEVTEIPNEAEPSAASISIYVRFTDTTGKEFVLGKLLELNNTIVKKIIDLNNG